MRCTRELGEVELKKNLCRFVDDCFYDFHMATIFSSLRLLRSLPSDDTGTDELEEEWPFAYSKSSNTSIMYIRTVILKVETF